MKFVASANGTKNVPPANTVAPVISGFVSPGNTLLGAKGTWTGAQSFTYQWYRSLSDTMASKVAITFAGENVVGDEIDVTLGQITADIVDWYFQLTVTAHNGGGSTSADSNVLGPGVDNP
jgi:hypothetical protein